MTLPNRSLERGLSILECFKPGVGVLAHHDIAERTGLPKATVTRLIGTLRAQGYLVADEPARGYRLGVPILSLSHSLRLGNELIEAASPLIGRIARETSTIIGFGTAHGTDIVYLDAANGDPARVARRINAGMRTPISISSIGRAFLAGLLPGERQRWLGHLRRADSHWRTGMLAEIERSVQEVRTRGYCLVLWNKGKMASIGAPVAVRGNPLHAFNVGYMPPEDDTLCVPKLMSEALRELVACVDRLRA
jgi:DNA-binding IclR family transcriptional regulator